jgi:hypothetical protein
MVARIEDTAMAPMLNQLAERVETAVKALAEFGPDLNNFGDLPPEHICRVLPALSDMMNGLNATAAAIEDLATAADKLRQVLAEAKQHSAKEKTSNDGEGI